MPALDADESGNILLGWYDRRDSGGNLEYRPYIAYISTSSGVILGPTAISSISSVAGSYFIGDYHEIWRHNYPDGARLNDAWIAHPSGFPGDVYVTDVKSFEANHAPFHNQTSRHHFCRDSGRIGLRSLA